LLLLIFREGEERGRRGAGEESRGTRGRFLFSPGIKEGRRRRGRGRERSC